MGLGISETENIGDDPGEMGDNLETANFEGETCNLWIQVYYVLVSFKDKSESI